MIIGIVVAAVVVVVLTLLGVLVWRRRRRPPSPSKDIEHAADNSAGVKADSMDTSDSIASPAGIDSSASQRVVLGGEAPRGDIDRGGSGSVVSSLASEMQHALSSAEYCHLVAPQDVQQLRQVGASVVCVLPPHVQPCLRCILQVGSGSFSNVYLALWRGTPVALKRLILRDMAAEDSAAVRMQVVEGVKRELAITAGTCFSQGWSAFHHVAYISQYCSGLNHPNVLRFLGIMVGSESHTPSILVEFAERGSLFTVLSNARGAGGHPALGWSRRLAMALDAALGLEYLHARSLVHCDLKSPNLLVDKNWTVKVGDFGASKVLHPTKSKTSTVQLNPTWLAPEVIELGQHSKPADVYRYTCCFCYVVTTLHTSNAPHSFGIIMWELLTLQVPFEDVPVVTIIFWVVTQDKRPPVPEDLAEQLGSPQGLEEYVTLMRACWARDPALRPTFSEIVVQLRALRRRGQSLSTTPSTLRALAPWSSTSTVPSL